MTAQLSRERLEEIAALEIKTTDAGTRYSPKAYADVRSREIVDMARMLLAGMDSEPVAVIDKEGNPMTRAECNDDRVFAICCKVGTPLYAAPPAPAIPDHLELIDKGRLMMLERSHQTLLDYRADSVWYWQGDEDDRPEILSCPVIMSVETLRELLAKSAPTAPVAVPDDVSGPLAHAYKELTPTFMRNHIDVFERYGIYPDGSAGIQAMRIALDGMTRRAAMLKAGPVTGWIKCSERMPPLNNGQMWIYSPTRGVQFMFALAASGEYYDTCDSEEDITDATHWMPILAPDAPEQENKL